MSPNPSGAPGILCLNCVNAKSVATGITSTSPRCLNPKNTVVIMTSARMSVITPECSPISVISKRSKGRNIGCLQTAIVETIL